MDVEQTAHKLWVYWSISYTFSEGRGRAEGYGEWKGTGVCCPSVVSDLIFDFVHLSTRFTVKFNSRLTAEKRVSLSRSLSLLPSLSLWTELACFGVLLSHIFAHGLTKCAEKRRQHFVYFCTQPTTTTIKTSSTRQHMAFHADDNGDDKWAKCTQKYQNIWYI